MIMMKILAFKDHYEYTFGRCRGDTSMIRKLSKPMLAVYSGIVAFLIILIFFFTYFYASNQTHWWRELLSARSFIRSVDLSLI